MVEFEKVAVLDIKQTSNTAWILKVSFHKYYTLIIIWKIREILEYLKLTDLNIIHFLYNEHTKFFSVTKISADTLERCFSTVIFSSAS